MKIKTKKLSLKTIDLTPQEVRKAICYYLENAEFAYEKELEDGQLETVNESHVCFAMGDNTTIKFEKDGSAVLMTYYGG